MNDESPSPRDPGAFWDQRYRDEIYAFGTEPNAWFRECIEPLPPGRLLLPGEGEGRNAVHAARRGWRVDAFDPSAHGQRKAIALAGRHGVTLDYACCLLNEYDLETAAYDVLAIVFVHLPPEQRRAGYRRLTSALRPGGVLIAELYAKEQLALGTGGPRDRDMLYALEYVDEDFPAIDFVTRREITRDIHEGALHQGPSRVIQLLGYRRDS